MASTLHVTAASAGLILGVLVLASPKGTTRHRLMGASYVTALVIVDLAALFIHDEAGFGVFHALAIVSLVTVATALVVIAAGRRRPAFVATHAYCMAWSYAGLVAAGCGQVTTTVGDASALMVLVVILAALAVSGVAIHTRVPSALVAVLR